MDNLPNMDGISETQSSRLYTETIFVSGNRTIVCHDPHKISSNGFWTKQNPLHFATPLLLLQLSLVSTISMLVDFIIKPLGQCPMVSQIFGGIIFGPSMLGHDAVMGAVLFPPRCLIIFETFASFGIIFFVFIIGVKMDPMVMLRPGWKPMIIGSSAMLTTLGFSLLLCFGLKHFVPLDPDVASSLPIIAASQCILSFENVSSVLTELKMLQTDLGRLAITASMFCDLVSICFMSTACAILQTSNHDAVISITEAGVFVVLVLLSIYVIHPLILRCARRVPEGKQPTESQVMGIFITLLVAGFVSETIGQHFMFGPMAIGLATPQGPPLGSAIIAKLEIPIGKILYPSFLTASGLKTNVFNVQFQSFWTVGVIVVLSCIVKLLAVMLPASFMDMNARESLVLGLIMNAKGISELVLFNVLLYVKAIKSESFTLCVMSVLIVTAIVTPLIKLVFDPSRRKIPVRRRTVQHSKRDAEIRVLVCLHDQENVPEVLNLLEASNATHESPITVIAVLLVELVGRANPMLIAHQPHRMVEPSGSKSGRIINALRQYEFCNESCVTIQSFSSISHYETMHEDICRVALDQNATIIILPFHKRMEIDGSVGAVNRPIQTLNSNVAEHAPCSVAIFVDRGILRGPGSILNTQSAYLVGVVFIGGADDAEALCYAGRMARNPNVCVTVFRFLLLGNENSRERKIENNLIDELRRANLGNENFVYQEEMLRDSVGLAASVRGLGSRFDLVLLGRNHQESGILVGLSDWIECPELGAIGDMLAEADSERTSSLLVVQQQRLKGKFQNRLCKPVHLDQDLPFTS